MFVHIEPTAGEPRIRGLARRDRDASAHASIWGKWHWDGRQLTAEVDRYGFRRYFYAQIGSGIAIADNITELLDCGASPEHDDAAIAVFLRMGFYIGDDTAYKAIRAFPVGGQLSWSTAAGLSVREHALRPQVDASIGLSEAIDGYVDRFREAVRKFTTLPAHSAVLPISGGRDSRHIAFELHRCGFEPGLVFTQKHFSYRTDEDARVGALVAKALQWPHVTFAQCADPLKAEHNKNRMLEGMVKEHAWMVAASEKITSPRFTHIFDGIAGDVLSNGLFCRRDWDDLLTRQRWPELFTSMCFAGAREDAIKTVLRPDLLRRWSRDIAQARWQAELERHLGADDPLTRFMFDNRTRRCIASAWPALVPTLEVLTPYLDDAVFEHLSRLPRQFFLDRDFHDKSIARAAPHFANIPYETKGIRADGVAHGAVILKGISRSRVYWTSGLLNKQRVWPRLTASLASKALSRRMHWLGEALTSIVGLESSGRSM